MRRLVVTLTKDEAEQLLCILHQNDPISVKIRTERKFLRDLEAQMEPHEEIKRDTRIFVQENGGSIKKIPIGVSGRKEVRKKKRAAKSKKDRAIDLLKKMSAEERSTFLENLV